MVLCGLNASYLVKLCEWKARLPKIFVHLLNCPTLEAVTMVMPLLSMAPWWSIPGPSHAVTQRCLGSFKMKIHRINKVNLLTIMEKQSEAVFTYY